jgi:hypothetical protein
MRFRRTALAGAFMLTIGIAVPFIGSTPAGAVEASVPFYDYADASGICPDPPPYQASNNVAGQLTQFINSIPVNGTGLLEPNACYETDSQVTVNGKQGLLLNGRGATFVSNTSNGSPSDYVHVKIQNSSSGVKIENLKIWGQHTSNGWVESREDEHGFFILGSNFITLENVKVDHVYGDYVYMHSDDGGQEIPTFIWVTDSEFGSRSSGTSGAGRQELSIIDGNTVSVTGNFFGYGARSAVDLELADGSIVVDVDISNNHFGPNALSWFANQGGNGRINNVSVTNNTVDRSLAVDVVTPNAGALTPGSPNGFRRQNFTFRGNVQTGGTANGTGGCSPDLPGDTMRFVGVYGVIIDANTLRMDTTHQCQFLARIKNSNARVTNNLLQSGQKFPNPSPNGVPPALGGKYVVGIYPQAGAQVGSHDSIVCERANHEPDSAHTAPITPASIAVLNGGFIYYLGARTWTPPNIPAACSGY